MKRFASVVLGIAIFTTSLGSVPLLGADQPGTRSLDELLDRIRRGLPTERQEDRQRESEFLKRKDDQQRLLEEARSSLAAVEGKSEEMERQFQESETRLAQLEATLQDRLGTLGEAFGVVRQVADNTRGLVEDSLVSSQIENREQFLANLAQSKSLPSIEALEQLWFILQQEMTESGKVVRFRAAVTTTDGSEVEREVTRIGNFNALSSGKYLHRSQDTRKLTELSRQPASRHLRTIRDFEAAASGLVPLDIDPTRGQILSVLVATPHALERVEQGGPIGVVIILLGTAAGLLGLARLAYMIAVNRKVGAQQKNEQANEDNPLGRVLAIYEVNRGADAETLELKLDEAILRETAQLDRFLWAIKLVSVVAPLLGLLGTVTGMIQTFQVIVLYGTSDPKLMAGGISEALVTTMLGLIVAIPLVLIHALVASLSKHVVDILEEQSAGMIARRAEQSDAVQ